MQHGKFRFNVKSFAVIILAAGRSSRLGSPKQLLNYRGKTLLQHSIDAARDIRSEQVIVVLGSGKDLIKNNIDSDDIKIVENPNWENGISSSINAGINALKDIAPEIDALILMVCDQPYADSGILEKLLSEQADSGKAMVGCRYENTKGTPALFHSSLFPDLLALKGDSGAKKLFEKYKDVTTFVSFQDGGIDIDTSEDYQNLAK